MSFGEPAPKQLERFMAAIRFRESTNNYAAFNDKTHKTLGNARGAYQIMSGNWAGWAKQAGITGADHRDPAAQDFVAAHMFKKYYDKYGDWRLVAAAWHGGEGAANSIAKGLGWTSDMDGTPTVKYAQQVVGAAFGEHGPQQQASGFTAQDAQQAMMDPGSWDELLANGQTRAHASTSWADVLNSMSQVVMGSPDRFVDMYGTTAAPEQDDTVDLRPDNIEDVVDQSRNVTTGDRKAR